MAAFKRDSLLDEWRGYLTPELRKHFKRVGSTVFRLSNLYGISDTSDMKATLYGSGSAFGLSQYPGPRPGPWGE